MHSNYIECIQLKGIITAMKIKNLLVFASIAPFLLAGFAVNAVAGDSKPYKIVCQSEALMTEKTYPHQVPEFATSFSLEKVGGEVFVTLGNNERIECLETIGHYKCSQPPVVEGDSYFSSHYLISRVSLKFTILKSFSLSKGDRLTHGETTGRCGYSGSLLFSD
jgi:hypothetical protein